MTEYSAARLKEFGTNLRKRRGALGLNAKTFAARIGISPQHLSQLETGYSRPDRKPVGPGNKVIEAISSELRWPIAEIRRELGQLPDEDARPIGRRWEDVAPSYNRPTSNTTNLDESIASAHEKLQSLARQRADADHEEALRQINKDQLQSIISSFSGFSGDEVKVTDALVQAVAFLLSIDRKLQAEKSKTKEDQPSPAGQDDKPGSDYVDYNYEKAAHHGKDEQRANECYKRDRLPKN